MFKGIKNFFDKMFKEVKQFVILLIKNDDIKVALYFLKDKAIEEITKVATEELSSSVKRKKVAKELSLFAKELDLNIKSSVIYLVIELSYQMYKALQDKEVK